MNTVSIDWPSDLPAERTAFAVLRERAQGLASGFAATAAERDRRGGTPKAERDALRASGLLGMSIPVEFGGLGSTWRETLEIVRVLARADSSIAHVFGFHHLMLATVRLFSQRQQWQPWLEQTALRNWFWGNALNPLDERTQCRMHPHWRVFSGQKSFCSGALDSEMLIVSAREEDEGALVIAAVPTSRSGIYPVADWNNMGQRQTDSGSVNFESVRVELHELLSDPGPLSSPFACLRPLIAQLILTNVYYGIAQAAFDDARHYALNEARPWPAARLANTTDDPYILGHFGDFWVALEGGRLLADQAADRLDEAWARDVHLDREQRGEVAIAVAAAKVAATRTGLDLCTRMFDVAGARATHGELRMDRHWRNLRTHTLHDPVAYKVRELGEWALSARYPAPSFYS